MTSARAKYNAYASATNRKKSDVAIRDEASYRLTLNKHPRRLRALKAKRASSMT